ncbi:CBS domain-containing protein [Burkholderia plantarii]|uniref:CBS domain-containing protein n=1 Tax=Burkholderia plantarii TaxID=41899 RepID=UPI0018DB62F9|nr:CBS domain-containing protein [Burkholderia plantarii]MBI0330884.1 CBS domain-containing protein [Burkholderia plantarii]
MQRIRQIMSRDVVHVAPSDSIHHAAQLMARHDVGALPVCGGPRVVGMVTDRDIVTRALASGKDGSATVREVASVPIEWCSEDDDADAVRRKMASTQVRRIPVMSRDRRLVGMVSLGDFATRCGVAERDAIGETLDYLSQPR